MKKTTNPTLSEPETGGSAAPDVNPEASAKPVKPPKVKKPLKEKILDAVFAPLAGTPAVAEQQEAIDAQNTQAPGNPLATPPPGGWPLAEPPQYPPTPTLNPDDPNAKVVETPLAQTLPATPPAPPVLTPPVAVAAAPQPSGIRCFKKVNVALPFFVKGVGAVKFDFVGGNIGVGTFNESQNAELIVALDAAAEAKKGGIVAISEAERDELKKNPPWTPSRHGSQPALRVWDSKPRSLSRPAARENAAVDSSAASGSRGPAAPVTGEAAGAGKSPAVFAPAMKKKSEFKGPVLRPPASGQFRPEVPRV